MELPLERARVALVGLNVGDAFGQQFFREEEWIESTLASRELPTSPWPYTDDTLMALSVFECLRKHGEVEREALAESFADHYDSDRGYGPAVHRLLKGISRGESWEKLSSDQFDGAGSYGNGGAMRVAPVGGYFQDDLERVVVEAERSAEVTHRHREGVAGAVAVAVATAVVGQWRGREKRPTWDEFYGEIVPRIPDGETRVRVEKGHWLGSSASVVLASSTLGNGRDFSTQRTVPLVLWLAARHLDDFGEALWNTVAACGDRDTTAAMVGGIVAAYVGEEGIPKGWRDRCEPLPEWPFISR